MEYVILVDEQDNPIGTMEKMEAHEKALLHRAFSVFIFDQAGKMLLQQRAESKYHSGGLWTNTCCSHPRDGEETIAAAHRRMEEEMGFDCEMAHEFHFVYQAVLDQGLTEHELDHVFTGVYEGAIVPNPEEVMDYKYIAIDDLTADITAHPERYTEWFKIALPELLASRK